MIGFVYWINQDGEEIAIDFNEVFGSGIETGDIILLVSRNVIEPI
jgi:hypothetical protein